jgi:hypothetical protein
MNSARPLQNLGRRLQVRAESQQAAIAILHHELALVPGHVAKSPKSGGECGSVRKLEGSKVGMLKREAKADPSLRSGWHAAMGRAKSAPLQKLGQRRAELAGGVNTAA